MPRERNFTVPVRTRIKAETAKALIDEAEDRGADVGSLVRLFIEAGLPQIGELSPVRRKRAAVRDREVFAASVRHLGSIAGNLQRLYMVVRDQRRLDLPELQAAKEDVQRTAAMVRRALGQDDDA